MYTYTGIGAEVFIPPLAGGMPGPGSGARYAVLPRPAGPLPSASQPETEPGWPRRLDPWRTPRSGSARDDSG
jgi:hypothetical protein